MRRLAALLAGIVLVALVAAPAGAASGAASPDAAPVARVSLLEQPAWSTLGGDVPLRLALAGSLAGLEARAIVHASMTSRTGFERTLDGDRLGSTVATFGAPAATLPFAPTGGRILTLKLQDPNQPRDPSRLRLPLPRSSRTGVYPVEIELRDPESGERVSSFVTSLVAVAPAVDGPRVGEPLNVAWIWKIAADPATEPGGALRPGFTSSIGPDGRLTRLASAAARATSVPLTLAPGPETLESWAQRAKTDPVVAPGITALRAASRTKQVLTGPYVPIDIPSLERAGLGDDAALELAQGSITLGNVLNTRLDARTTDVAPLDSAALARLELSQVDRVVVAPDALVPPQKPPQFTPAQPFTLESGGRQFSTVQTDAGLEHLLEGDGPPALRAANFLAGLAIVAIEQPNETRGVAVEMPARWDPEPALLSAVLKGFTDSPLVAPVTLEQLFAHVPLEQTKSGAVVRELAPLPASPPTVDPSSYRSTRGDLAAFATTVGADDPAILLGHRGLLISLTSVWPGAIGRRQSAARLSAIDHGITQFANLIQTPPSGLTVTLTSRKANLPLSFNNLTGKPVTVRITFQSDKLVFPDGRVQELHLLPKNTTKTFPVVTRASGTFPLNVSVTTRDGHLPLRAARYTVRSTVFSGVGVVLTIGAGLFLAIWWITHWRRSRRRPVRPATLAT
ncbi:MAG TPA: DUF6049 family protein [Acidimicrobiia bacterium]